MFLTDIHHVIDTIQADAIRTATWARRYEIAIAARKSPGTRGIVGHALINLGRLIAAESTPARAQVRVGR